jgi:RNA polymerase sigma factor (sigma-70 family)
MTDDRSLVDGRLESAGEDLNSTAELLARAHQGDEEALERLFARHLEPLRRWASGRLPKWARDLADTDDLVQDTLLKTFKALENFEPRGVGALQAYLRRAILNRIKDELRRKARRPEVTDLDEGQIDDGLSPLEQAIGREAVERYERALSRLQPAEQDAIIGRIELGYTYEEMAKVMDKPSGEAARKTAERALVRLVEEMERDDGGGPSSPD